MLLAKILNTADDNFCWLFHILQQIKISYWHIQRCLINLSILVYDELLHWVVVK